MNSKILFAITISMFACAGVSAQLSFKTEYFGKSSYWLGKDDEPRERIGEAEGSAMVYQGNLNIPLSTKMNKNGKPIIWGVGMSGSYVSLSNKNFTSDLVIPEIMNADLGIYHSRPIGNRWSLMAGIGGGIYLPSPQLSELQWKHVPGSINSIFLYTLRPNLQFGGGNAINSQFG